MTSPKPTEHTPPLEKKEDKPSGSRDGDSKKDSGRTPPQNRASHSPSLRFHSSRNHKIEKPHERVVERITRDLSSTGSWPQLTKTNYNKWSLQMWLKLQARDLWDIIEYGDDNYQDDHMALDAIYSAVPLEMTTILAIKETKPRLGKPSRLSASATSAGGWSRRRLARLNMRTSCWAPERPLTISLCDSPGWCSAW
jgi:hypothetical protein